MNKCFSTDHQALAILEAISPAGTTYTQQQLADVAGVSKSAIYAIEKKALKKLRNRAYGDLRKLKNEQ